MKIDGPLRMRAVAASNLNRSKDAIITRAYRCDVDIITAPTVIHAMVTRYLTSYMMSGSSLLSMNEARVVDSAAVAMVTLMT